MKSICENHRKCVNFDEALTETKYGILNYFLILICGLIQINVVLETLSISFVLPIVGCELQLTQSEKSMLTAISFIGIIVSANCWGYLADTIGRRRIMLPTMLGGVLITFLSSFSINYWMLLILRFLNGILISATSGTVFAYLGEFHTNKDRNFAIMASSFICAFVGFLLPGFAWLIINSELIFEIESIQFLYNPWRLYIFGCSIFGLIGGLCLLRLPESPKFMLSIGNTQQTQMILQQIFHWNTGKSIQQYPDFDIKLEEDTKLSTLSIHKHQYLIMNIMKSMWLQFIPLFSKQHFRKTTLACFMQFCSYFTAHGLYVWLPEILNIVGEYLNSNIKNDHSYTVCEIFEKNYNQKSVLLLETTKTVVCNNQLDETAYLYAIILEALYVGFFIVMSCIMKITGRIVILFVVLIGCGLCGIASSLVQLPILGIYLYVILLLCVLGVTIVNAIMVDLYPTHLRASAVGISLMFGRIGTVVGSNITGILLPHNCQGLFLFAGISLIFNGFLGFLIPKQ